MKVDEWNGAQAFQAVIDRVEDRCVGLLQGQHRSRDVKKRREIAGQSVGKRHFHEDHRLGGKRRLKKSKAAAVCVQTAAEGPPPTASMYRVIIDQHLLNKRSSL